MKPTPEDRAAGIKHKYNITRADGSPVDPQGKYFVLRLDIHDGCDQTHVLACRAAARTYADHIEHHLPALSADLRRLLCVQPNAGNQGLAPQGEHHD